MSKDLFLEIREQEAIITNYREEKLNQQKQINEGLKNNQYKRKALCYRK